MKLDALLQNVARLAVDSAPLIYFVERNPVYIDRMRAVMDKVQRGQLQLAFSVITLPEVLQKPIARGDMQLKTAYMDLLTRTRHVGLHSLTQAVAERAAALRATHNLRTPDAIQVATALEYRCEAFLTNDNGLQRIRELPILIVGEIEL